MKDKEIDKQPMQYVKYAKQAKLVCGDNQCMITNPPTDQPTI